MADAKPKAASSMARRGPRRLRLAAPFVAALAIMLSARGDSFAQHVEVGSRAFLDSPSATEGYCYAHYGIGGEQVLPQCPQRFGTCMGFQRAARERLDAEWDRLAPRLRRSCVREAQEAFLQDQEDPAIRARVSHGGYRQGFAHDAVERCIARRLHRPVPAAWSAQPDPPICHASPVNLPPPEARWTPGENCRRIIGNAGGPGVDQCVAEESAAQARLQPRWPSLSPAVVATCSSQIRAHSQFQGGPDTWSYKGFEACLAHIAH